MESIKNKEYCENKVKELFKEREILEEHSKKFREHLISLNGQEESTIELIDDKEYDLLIMRISFFNRCKKVSKKYRPFTDDVLEMYKKLQHINYEINKYSNLVVDTDWNKMSGDIITDPCYLFENDKNYDIISKHGMIHNTMCGDWSCSTFDCNTKESIGEFCSDAGLVCIIPLSVVMEINPNFNYHITKPWTTTLIKNFDGEVRITIKEEKFEDGYIDYNVSVEGRGSHNFFTAQGGF